MREWLVDELIEAADLAVLSEGVTQFGRSQAIGGNARPIACILREGQHVVAGGSGRTEFSRLFINYLWVAESLRSRGLGSQVLARLEFAARERGCKDALIETLSNRTASLYARLGYEMVATIPSYVGLFTKYVLVKPFTGRGQESVA